MTSKAIKPENLFVCVIFSELFKRLTFATHLQDVF